MAACCCRFTWHGGWLCNADGVKRLLAAMPLALLTVALYGFGFWLLLQPMQMRGMMMGGM